MSGVDVLDGGRKRRRAGHVLRRRRRLVTVDDDRGEHGREGLDAIRGLLGRQLVGFRIDDLDREPFGAHERGDEAGPDRVLDRGQPLAERLVDSRAAAGINENEIRELLACGRSLPMTDSIMYGGRPLTSL